VTKTPITHGCCVDKACGDDTCMQLPEGKTCDNCCHKRRCFAFGFSEPNRTYCDWFPRRFIDMGTGA
jgi:hypothetical protein